MKHGLLKAAIAAFAFLTGNIAIHAQSSTPAISSLSLPQGPVGMGFVINGANFGATQGNSNVMLGSSALTVLSWSNTSITVQLPPGAATGSVVVTVPGTTPSNGATFTVTTPFSGTAGSDCAGVSS